MVYSVYSTFFGDVSGEYAPRSWSKKQHQVEPSILTKDDLQLQNRKKQQSPKTPAHMQVLIIYPPGSLDLLRPPKFNL